jgi:hypothetical protein
MIYKYNFSIEGKNFYPEKILNEINGDFIVDYFFSPGDKKIYIKHDVFSYGGILFWHPQKFSTEENVAEYENAFIKFIENNYDLFIENGVMELEIYMEIFYDGGQCNFEIFNKELLNKIGNLKVSLPISIYILKNEQLEQWENEVRLQWENK